MNRWRVERLHRSLGSYKAAWDEVNTRLFSAHPMLSSAFVDALLRRFGNGNERLCVLDGADGEPEAMCIVRPHRLGVWASFLPSQAQIGPTLLQGPKSLGNLPRCLPGYVGQIDFLCNDPSFGNLGPSDRLRKCVPHALTFNISLTGTFDSYWDGRNKHLRDNMRRYAKRAAELGLSPVLVVATQPDEVRAAVQRFADLEARGWKGKLGTALGSTPTQLSFYFDVMQHFARCGRAVAYELKSEGALIASRLMIVSPGGMGIMLKTTYDEELKKVAPGRLLLREAVRDAFTRMPGGVIEFCTNASADQLAWATQERIIGHVTVYRDPLSADMSLLMRALRGTRRPASRSPRKNDERVKVFGPADELPAEVHALLKEAEGESFCLGSAWYRNFLQTVPMPGSLRLFYTLWQDECPCALLPVLVKASWLPRHRNIESLTNYYTTLYAPVLTPSSGAEEIGLLIQSILKDHRPVNSLRFAPMDPASRAYVALTEGLCGVGMLALPFLSFRSWYLPVQGDWNSYLASRAGELRNTIKRMERKLQRDGGTLEIVKDADDLEYAISAYKQVYAASWKHGEPYPDFMPGLIHTCAAKGWLRLGIARLGSKAIAAQLWIVANGKAHIYKLAYDSAYKAYSPGTVLTAHLMRYVFEKDGVGEVDYLMGDEPYKRNWMSDRRERWGIIAYNLRSPGGLLGAALELLSRAIKPLRNVEPTLPH